MRLIKNSIFFNQCHLDSVADSETISLAIVRELGFSVTTTVYQLMLQYDLFHFKKILIADSNPKKKLKLLLHLCVNLPPVIV